MRFFIGMHCLGDIHRLPRVCVSINRLRRRRSPTFKPARRWIMDSGAFTEISKFGEYRHTPADYVADASKWVEYGNCEIVVSQDYMCEPHMLKLTGMSIRQHQRLTIKRYEQIKRLWEHDVPIMPVLQGYHLRDYLEHVEQYGDRLAHGAWVGVGSVCKRQGDVSLITDILSAIKDVRPDLRLHGFGVKQTALMSRPIHRLLYSADSMAWSFAARYEGRDQNSWLEAKRYFERVEALH